MAILAMRFAPGGRRGRNTGGGRAEHGVGHGLEARATNWSLCLCRSVAWPSWPCALLLVVAAAETPAGVEPNTASVTGWKPVPRTGLCAFVGAWHGHLGHALCSWWSPRQKHRRG